MKKSLMTLGVLALFVLMAYGQEKKFALYSVAFYNMENLYRCRDSYYKDFGKA